MVALFSIGWSARSTGRATERDDRNLVVVLTNEVAFGMAGAAAIGLDATLGGPMQPMVWGKIW